MFNTLGEMFKHEILLKVIGWCIAAIFLASGFYFFDLMMSLNSIRPAIWATLSFGVVYWFSQLTYEGSNRVLWTSIGLMIVSWFVADFLTMFYLGDTLAFYLNRGFYTAWGLTSVLLGAPVMLYTFWKEA